MPVFPLEFLIQLDTFFFFLGKAPKEILMFNKVQDC